jgi:pimeloyl-ACP methyl ester carboxylesterase
MAEIELSAGPVLYEDTGGEAGRNLAASFPHSRFVEIPGSRTLIPIDQPQALAGAIASFVGNH